MSAARRSLAAVAVALLAAVPASAGSLPVIPGSSTGRSAFAPLVRPASVVYAGDGSGALGGFDGRGRNRFGHFAWTKWTSTVAAGHGANWIDNCRPDCAGGRFVAHRATATAFRPRHGHFTRLRIRTRQDRRWFAFTVAIVGSGRHLHYATQP